MAVTPEQLSTFHPFSTLDRKYLEAICDKSQIDKYTKGKIVFKRGKDLPSLYYLVDGEVKLVDANFQSRHIDLNHEEARYALNELNPSKESAVAASDVVILELNRHVVDAVLTKSESQNNQETVAAAAAVSSSETSGFVTSEINYLDAYVFPQSPELDTERNDWMSQLLESPLFTSIPASNIQKLFSQFEEIEVEAGQSIFEANDPGDYFYVIASGSVQVIPLSGGNTIQLSEGSYFGEEALVGDTTRNASVKMQTKGSLMRLSKEDFVELLQNPLFKYIERDQIDDFGPQVQLLDVRLPIEHRHVCVRGSRNIALGKLRDNIQSLDPGYTYVVTDDGGSRSKVAVQLLLQTGLSAVILNHSEQCYS
ncbi:cyclic nucleotide-binding domain-containing protein [Sessilibacter sp. MAH2]